MAKKEVILDIGSKCYLVRREFAFKKRIGGKIIPARLKTYENIAGKVEPVFTAIGGSSANELRLTHYIPFINTQEAVDAIIS